MVGCWGPGRHCWYLGFINTVESAVILNAKWSLFLRYSINLEGEKRKGERKEREKEKKWGGGGGLDAKLKILSSRKSQFHR